MNAGENLAMYMYSANQTVDFKAGLMDLWYNEAPGLSTA